MFATQSKELIDKSINISEKDTCENLKNIIHIYKRESLEKGRGRNGKSDKKFNYVHI